MREYVRTKSSKKIRKNKTGVVSARRSRRALGLFSMPKVYTFKRMSEVTVGIGTGGFTDGTTSNNSLQWTFMLAGAYGYLGGGATSAFPAGTEWAELQQMFDQYRIDGVAIRIMSRVDPALQTTSTAYLPLIYITKDSDDSNYFATKTAVLQCASTKCFQPGTLNQQYRTVVRPRAQVQLYRSLINTGYAPAQGAVWIDTAQHDVLHYGLKLWTDGAGGNASLTFQFTFYISCKYSH